MHMDRRNLQAYVGISRVEDLNTCDIRKEEEEETNKLYERESSCFVNDEISLISLC